MLEDFLAVNATKNPVCQIIYRARYHELMYVIQQYSIFPKVLVDLMKISQHKAAQAGWHQLADELQENIAEEMGGSTQGISHYDLLAGGLEMELQVPVKSTLPSEATQTLLKTMDHIFDRSMAHLSGATYAIEATSIPELTLVRRMIELLLEGALSYNLQYFFDMHLNEWEPEHEADLRKSLEPYISPQEYGAFSEGFRAVLTAMDIWWLQLTAEAIAQSPILQNA